MSGGHRPIPGTGLLATSPRQGSGAASGRGTRIPDDWEPEPFHPHTVAYDIAAAMDSDRLRWEAERFHAYWMAKPGGKALKMNWQAAWTNWILKTRDYQGRARR